MFEIRRGGKMRQETSTQGWHTHASVNRQLQAQIDADGHMIGTDCILPYPAVHDDIFLQEGLVDQEVINSRTEVAGARIDFGVETGVDVRSDWVQHTKHIHHRRHTRRGTRKGKFGIDA